MRRCHPASVTALAIAVLLAGCATRAVDVVPAPANPADFAGWSCERIDTEADKAQQRAADVAYAVDERVGNNIVALGIGLAVFWPVLLAMRPDGVEAQELARLKGRYETLREVAQRQGCPPPGAALPDARAAALPVVLGERLVYEDRPGATGPMRETTLQLTQLRRNELEFKVESAGASAGAVWKQDLAGNVTQAPAGSLLWPRLLRQDLVLGQVLGGEMWFTDDLGARARVRGQVMAVGPQVVAGRRFDVAVIELFGDAQRGELSTRLDGALVVDRSSGLLLRLDLRSAQPGFTLQRRLARVEPPG